MNKALHVFIYLFLILTGVALWFEFQLNEKRTEMKDRNRMQEDFIMDVSHMTETGDDDDKESKKELLVDVSPVEAKIIDSPDQEDVLDEKGYDFYLEKLDHKFFTWGEAERNKLRQIYVLDDMGKPVLDGTDKMTRDSPEDLLLKQLKKALEMQKDRLAATREAITVLREQLEKMVAEINRLKPEARQDKVTIVERDEKIAKLESEKAELENQNIKKQAQIEELEREKIALKDEVETAKGETEAAKEELEKEKELTKALKKLVEELRKSFNNGTRTEAGTITSVPAGDKGKIIEADNENMFAIVEFTPAAMKELKGDDLMRPLPPIEFGIKRAGYNGPAGEFVGRIRLRQEVPGKNYIICDILSNWSQDDTKLQADDVIFAD